MCYSVVWTHSCECDVRTLVLSPDAKHVGEAVVDPLATPKRCACKSRRHIPAALRCDDHDCCMLLKRRALHLGCSCDNEIVYHRYMRSSSSNTSSPTASAAIRESGPPVTPIPWTTAWRTMPMLDENIVSAVLSGTVTLPKDNLQFRQLRSEVSAMGRRIYDLRDKEMRARTEFELQLISLRVLQDHEFDQSSTLEVMCTLARAYQAWLDSWELRRASRKAIRQLQKMALRGKGFVFGLKYLTDSQ